MPSDDEDLAPDGSENPEPSESGDASETKEREDTPGVADKILLAVEILTVIVLAVLICLAIGYEVYWIIRADNPEVRQQRFISAFNLFNSNWKLGVLLLVPLFYRTIRKFLERVEKVAGMTARPPRKAIKRRNPQPLHKSQES